MDKMMFAGLLAFSGCSMTFYGMKPVDVPAPRQTALVCAPPAGTVVVTDAKETLVVPKLPGREVAAKSALSPL